MTSAQEQQAISLMRLAQAGDKVAYASLLVLLTSVTRQFVRRRLGASVMWVDDVVQETLLSVHGARQTYDARRPFAPWFYAIASSRLIDAVGRDRRVRSREITTGDLPDAGTDPAGSTHDEIDVDAIRAAVKALPTRQRDVITDRRVPVSRLVRAADCGAVVAARLGAVHDAAARGAAPPPLERWARGARGSGPCRGRHAVHLPDRRPRTSARRTPRSRRRACACRDLDRHACARCAFHEREHRVSLVRSSGRAVSSTTVNATIVMGAMVASAKSRQRSTSNHTTAGTRERLVEAARYLFWEKGYAATGLAEILARADANSGSFYHFFDSKDALLRTVLETYVQLLEPHVLRPVWDTTPDAIARVFVLLDTYRQRLLDTECRYGCPIGRLAFEIDPENTPAHELIARNFTEWKKAVEACLRAAGLPRPAEVATLVLTVMEGGVMQARAYRTIEPFDACVRQLRVHLSALAGPAPTPRAAIRRQRRRS